MTGTSKRIRLTNHQKMEICARYDNALEFTSQGELRRWAQHQFNLPTLPSQALISHILKNKRTIVERGKIRSNGKSSKTTELIQLEKILLQHIQLKASKNIQLNGPEIRDCAEMIANRLELKKKFKFSNGWLQNFRQRHQLKKLLSDLQIVKLSPEPIEYEGTVNDQSENTKSVKPDADTIGSGNDTDDVNIIESDTEVNTIESDTDTISANNAVTKFETDPTELQTDTTNQDTDNSEFDITSNSSDNGKPENNDIEKYSQEISKEDKETHRNNELIDGLEKVLSNMSPNTDEEVIFVMTASKMLYKLKSNILRKKIRILEDI